MRLRRFANRWCKVTVAVMMGLFLLSATESSPARALDLDGDGVHEWEFWQEPLPSNHGGMYLATEGFDGGDEILSCLGQPSSNLSLECLEPTQTHGPAAICGVLTFECIGPLVPDRAEVTYFLSGISYVDDNCVFPSAQGCEFVFQGGPGTQYVVNQTDWVAFYENLRNEAVASPTPADINENQVNATVSSEPELPDSDWRSTFSNLRLFGPLPEEAVRLAATAGATVVLGLLILLPTQLINSTLEANASRVNRFFARFRREQSSTPKTRSHMILKAILVFLLASIITGFANPTFGFNLASLWFLLTTLTSFLLLNLVGTLLIWTLFHRRHGSTLPHLTVHYSYLLLIALTVTTSRLLGFEPALIFGAVIAIETGRILLTQNDQKTLTALTGRLQLASSATIITLGLTAWTIYNLLVYTALHTGTDTAPAQELTAALTTEALATLPVLLLPLTFLPGKLLYTWNKTIWALTYLTSLTLFLFILLPLPTSWTTISSSLTTWALILGTYTLFAILLWTTFTLTRKRTENTEAENTPEKNIETLSLDKSRVQASNRKEGISHVFR